MRATDTLPTKHISDEFDSALYDRCCAEGKEVYLSGSVARCPYPTETQESEAWRDGYDNGFA